MSTASRADGRAETRGAAAPVTRREENRRATIAEIKTLARRQLIQRGPGGLSLRAIAREMHTASSALYRYFASHDELINTLVVDAYTSLADTLTDAVPDDLAAAGNHEPADQPARRWWTMAHAFRRWALSNPADFALIFGTPVPGYQAPDQATSPAAARALAIPLDIYAHAVATGAADPDRTQIPPTIKPGELLTQLLTAATTRGDATSPADPAHPPRVAAITLTGWTGLLGHLVAETFGSLTRLVADTDQLYRAHLRTVMLGMGFHPHHIDHADDTDAALDAL